jgi:adenine-specific DNA glycosylase
MDRVMGRRRQYGAKLHCAITPRDLKLLQRWARLGKQTLSELVAELIEQKKSEYDGNVVRVWVSTRG